MRRTNGRDHNQLRHVALTPGYLLYPEGSCLIEMGNTRVLCTVSVEDRVPGFLRGTGKGWVTAEYGMLPRSTLTRTPRGESGRGQEIQRLIGRSLRAITDLPRLGDRTFTVDCDVLQADGGTRTAAITGAYVALYQAFLVLQRRRLLASIPFKAAVGAVSAGVVDGQALLDLCYEEDSRADVDLNVVMTDKGDLVEVQGTAEAKPFSRETLEGLLDMAGEGIRQLHQAQQEAIERLLAA
ncbi:MAG: ribonuclease PH [Dehalococcoidia bacterium]|nr:ribonuclease PH [Dehalococcoidia bacterium]